MADGRFIYSQQKLIRTYRKQILMKIMGIFFSIITFALWSLSQVLVGPPTLHLAFYCNPFQELSTLSGAELPAAQSLLSAL